MRDFMDFSLMLYFDAEGRIIMETFWAIFIVTIVRHFFSALFSAWPVIFSNKYSIANLRLKGSKFAQSGVSVILASHNTDREILQTVLSMREQTVKKMQIILVNDGSKDLTDHFAKDLLRKSIIDNYVRVEIRSGKAAALNAGFELVKYPYTIFCDTGTTYHKDAVEIALGYFENPNVASVSAGVGVRNWDTNLLTYLQKMHYFISCTMQRHALNFMGLQFVISGAFGLFRTDVLRMLGGHTPGTGEDLDLTLKLRNMGWRIEFSFYSVALTDVPETLGALLKQTLRWDRDGVKLTYQKFSWYGINPFSAKFDVKIALGFLDNFLVGFVLPILMYAYIAYFIFIHSEGFLFFLFTVYWLTLVVEFCSMIVALGFANRFDRDWRFLYYVPMYVILKQCFYEPVRFVAIWSELIFKHSFDDTFSPQKVRKALLEKGWK